MAADVRRGVKKTKRLLLEGGKGKEHVLHKNSVVRMWGRGSKMVCMRNLPLEGGKGEGTCFTWEKKGKEI